ncbi:MAG TPA: carboxypeptidase-like regulatory domain-containing protein [Balneolaceae bacterium]|nr:carboxypeptidase-like regulatory domain-containing protein [Balneolaceae bacterium]
MLQKNKMLYGLLILFVGFAMSFNTATAQVTGEDMGQQSQNAFKGKVVDASNGQPVADATVKVQGSDQEVTTDENGMFTISLMSAGQGMEQGGQQGSMGQSGVTLVITKDGYQELSKTIQPKQTGQEGQPMTFELEPAQGGGQGDY